MPDDRILSEEWIRSASGETWSNYSDGLSVMSNFVSPLVGIVPRVHHKMHDLDDAYTFAAGSSAASSQRLIGAATNAFNGGGATTEDGTYLAAVGESLERYSAAWVDPSIIISSYRRLRDAHPDSTVVGPEDLEMFSEDQFDSVDFPFERFLPDTNLAWKSGWDLTNEVPAFVPARLIQLAEINSDEARIGYATSSGLAFHITPAEAILAGLYELIERDAFMQVWYGSLSLPQLEPASDDKLSRLMERFCSPAGLSLGLVNMTSISGVPSVLAVTRNYANDIAPVALGASSAPSLREAAFTAAVESMQTRSWMRAEQRDGRSIDFAAADFDRDIKNFEDHIRLYCDGAAVSKTEFLTAGPFESDDLEPRVDVSSPNAQISDLLSFFQERRARILAFDLTSPDVTEGGGHVFRVFSPDLQMLDVGYRARYLGSSRLRRNAYDLGIVESPFELSELNPFPHPFP